jgi:hypothetical protein
MIKSEDRLIKNIIFLNTFVSRQVRLQWSVYFTLKGVLIYVAGLQISKRYDFMSFSSDQYLHYNKENDTLNSKLLFIIQISVLILNGFLHYVFLLLRGNNLNLLGLLRDPLELWRNNNILLLLVDRLLREKYLWSRQGHCSELLILLARGFELLRVTMNFLRYLRNSHT